MGCLPPLRLLRTIFHQLIAELDLLEERVGGRSRILNRRNNLMQLINFILLQLLFHPLLLLNLLLLPLLLSLLAFFLFPSSLFSLFLNPLLSLFVFSVTSLFHFLFLAKL